ncbi:uncharacterized protein LOC130778896 [Actinidia eriantha]|uniref:uncharacterized protein LOC130778896 n=1 Tax=Actinidia eriantha TaxID=165200 RepID=UPI002583E5CB|nr:uncharacterized protein LOC130778896 [Actinidia eriantha]
MRSIQLLFGVPLLRPIPRRTIYSSCPSPLSLCAMTLACTTRHLFRILSPNTPLESAPNPNSGMLREVPTTSTSAVIRSVKRPPPSIMVCITMPFRQNSRITIVMGK